MKHADESIIHSPLIGKSAKEIVEHFKGYNFVDDHGHRLDMCGDFKDLVNMAIGPQISANKTERNVAKHNIQGPVFF